MIQIEIEDKLKYVYDKTGGMSTNDSAVWKINCKQDTLTISHSIDR